jgi:type IV fimbrial biogenesis protein FimT
MKKLKFSGFTALELMIVIAIIAILAALAVPSFRTALDKQRISRAAEAVLADLRWARAEAIKRNRPVRVTFTTGGSWSYTINIVPALAVSDDILPKTVNGSDFPATTLSSANFAGDVAYTTFDPTRGIALNDGTVTLTSPNFSAGVTVSPLGRVHVCGSMGGYEACP